MRPTPLGVALSCLTLVDAFLFGVYISGRTPDADPDTAVVARPLLAPTAVTPQTTRPTAVATSAHHATHTAAAKYTPQATHYTTRPVARATTEAAAWYKNCTALRADHPAGVRKGEPGYRPALDRDHDGRACE